MKQLGIAWKNVLLHRVSTLVLLTVFALSSFALFWSFGYGNNIAGLPLKVRRNVGLATSTEEAKQLYMHAWNGTRAELK